jgi:hypothetical protein
MIRRMEVVAPLDTLRQLLLVNTCINGNADVASRYEELTKVGAVLVR